MKAKDLLDAQAPSIVLYGAAGTGKTALASQLKNCYIFDFDKGMITAKNLNDKFAPLRQNAEFDIYYDSNVYKPVAFYNAKTKLLEFQRLAADNKLPYKGMVIDSLTGMCRAIQLYVMQLSGDATAIPKIQHYGTMVNELELMLAVIRSFNIPVIVTAHENVIETDDATLIRIMSITKPHGMNKINWLFDEVLYTMRKPRGQGKVDYIVSGMPSGSIATKTRSGILQDIVVNDIGLEGLFNIMGYKQ